MKEYWYCIVGPVESSDIPKGGDLLMRIAVSDAIKKMNLSTDDVTLSSGWGITELQRENMIDTLHSSDVSWSKILKRLKR